MSAASKEIEEGLALTPKFDADGLVTCVATDAASGDVLMVAHMDAEALNRWYEQNVGYRPQQDDPSMTEDQLRELCASYEQEVRGGVERR